MTSRVVQITTVHRWNDTRIFRKQCQSLAAAGCEVTLIAPCTAADAPAACAGGVKLAAVPKYRFRAVRATLGSLAALREALRAKGDLYHLHDPELIGVGLVLKLFGKRVVYDAHEIVAEQILSKHWIPGRLRRLASWCARQAESAAAKFFDGVVGATPAIADQFPPHKATLVQNFPIVGELIHSEAQEVRRPSHRIVYVGVINRRRGVRELVAAMERLDRTDAKLTIAGEFGSPQLRAELMSMQGWARVEYLGWCDRKVVANRLSEAALGVVTFLPAPNHAKAQPNKLFEYMSAGLPVIASDFPLWRDIVDGARCGLLVDPSDPQAIAGAIDWLLAHPDDARAMGERGREAVRTKYNWGREFEQLRRLYGRLAPDGQSARRKARLNSDELNRAA